MAGETAIPTRDPIAGLNSIMGLFSGGSTTTTSGPSSSTTKSNLTADQLNALISDAMAPLNLASHGAGLRTYSDTNLALGRAQIAAKIGAQTAGTTTTESGKTSTTTKAGTLTQPGALQGLLTGAGVGMLASPVLKGVNKGLGIDKKSKSVEDWIASALSSGTTDLGGGLSVDALGSISGGSTAAQVSGMSMDPALASMLGLEDLAGAAGATDMAFASGVGASGIGAAEMGTATGADLSLFYDMGEAGTTATGAAAAEGATEAAVADGMVFDPTTAAYVGGALLLDKILGTGITSSVSEGISDIGSSIGDFFGW